MAAPVITLTGTGQSKSAGTTLVVTLTSTSYAVGDYVAIMFATDPGTAAAPSWTSAGTATLSAWTLDRAGTNGSGTSGCRIVFAYAKVTAAGTVTSVTTTHPSVTARCAYVFNVAGADATTPVFASSTSVSIAPTAGTDVAMLSASANECPTGTAVSEVATASDAGGNWTLGTVDSVTFGTSGGGAASNMSISAAWRTRDNCTGAGTSEYAYAPSAAQVQSLWAAWQFIPTSSPAAIRVVTKQSVVRAAVY